MNSHAIDIATVVTSWIASAVLTLALTNSPAPKKVEAQKEGTKVETSQQKEVSIKKELVEIERKLDMAENDLAIISQLIQLRQAELEALSLDKAEKKKK